MHVPLILVGTGEYYRKILKPALKLLQEKGVAYPILTVDIKGRENEGDVFFDSIEHRIRQTGESLYAMLKEFAPLSPVIILGHANQMHVSDAEDLCSVGFKILIEKPFALSFAELSRLERVIESDSSQIGLIEYYLTMKSAPLFALTKQLNPKSFFIEEKLFDHSETKQKELEDFLQSESISERLGKIKSVVVEVLEGEGSVGRLNHRGIHLIAKKFGGGVIHDLGIHAFAPLIPLENWIGELLPSTINVQTAHSLQYLAMAKTSFNLDSNDVAESYAEITLSTSYNIPVTVRVGKYVLNNTNRRGIVIVGENGEVKVDLSNPRVHISAGDVKIQDLFILPKNEDKYYPVLHAALLELMGHSPYSFTIKDASFKAQEIVLHALAAIEGRGVEYEYETGAESEEIF